MRIAAFCHFSRLRFATPRYFRHPENPELYYLLTVGVASSCFIFKPKWPSSKSDFSRRPEFLQLQSFSQSDFTPSIVQYYQGWKIGATARFDNQSLGGQFGGKSAILRNFQRLWPSQFGFIAFP